MNLVWLDSAMTDWFITTDTWSFVYHELLIIFCTVSFSNLKMVHGILTETYKTF